MVNMATDKSEFGRGHRFGGAWTELKLDAVEYYLRFYTGALKGKPSPSNPFELWYIDAFAGSGSRRVDRSIGGLFDGEPLGEETVDLAGSVLRALDVDPKFKRLVFIEGNEDRFRSLEMIAAANLDQNIKPVCGDANAELKKIFESRPWNQQRQGRGSHRAVVFLDPYGMSVEWSTLELLAGTRAADVWYLFPTGAVNRQLAGNFNRVDEHKQRALDIVFGTTDWRDDIYEIETQHGLFDNSIVVGNKRFNIDQIERYAQQRLTTIFSYVSEPLPLLNERATKIFSLFCLSNSSSEKALNLIRSGVKSVLKKFESGASRRMFGR
jgi:three-Cys-motif partner protein